MSFRDCSRLLKILLKVSRCTHYCTLSAQNLDTKEGGKKSHSRSLMGNFGKHKVSKTRDSFCWFMSDFLTTRYALLLQTGMVCVKTRKKNCLVTLDIIFRVQKNIAAKSTESSSKTRSQNQKYFCLTTSLVFISEEELLVFWSDLQQQRSSVNNCFSLFLFSRLPPTQLMLFFIWGPNLPVSHPEQSHMMLLLASCLFLGSAVTEQWLWSHQSRVVKAGSSLTSSWFGVLFIRLCSCWVTLAASVGLHGSTCMARQELTQSPRVWGLRSQPASEQMAATRRDVCPSFLLVPLPGRCVAVTRLSPSLTPAGPMAGP